MQPIIPAIFGVSSTSLNEEEKIFLNKANPLGVILFSRNISEINQVKKLVREIKDNIQHQMPLILIDQEGGRVSRLKQPNWIKMPPAGTFAEIAKENIEDAKKACNISYNIIGRYLFELGINTNCAPVLDILMKETHEVIGDRAFGNDASIVTILARTATEALIENQILPIMKHIPGHGRANVDSHNECPVVESSFENIIKQDLQPFKNLSDIVDIAMTAHVIYQDLDPYNVATTSSLVLEKTRKFANFNGVYISDCIGMNALTGNITQRAISAWKAGCDIVLYTQPNLSIMEAIYLESPDASEHLLSVIKNAKAKLPALVKELNIIEKYDQLKILLSKYNLDYSSPSGFDHTEQLHQ
jgi:beta-N-acetylhexosaminidase